MDDEMKKALEKAQSKDFLRQTFELTVQERADRWLEIKPHEITANSYFAAASMESYELYRDGHFYGAISLSQAVAQALVRFLCSRNSMKPTKSYDNDIKKLEKAGKIESELFTLLEIIWEDRNDYHHLSPTIETERQKLKALAKNKLAALQSIEGEMFAYSTQEGKLKPKYPQYWDLNASDNTIPVYLRIS